MNRRNFLKTVAATLAAGTAVVVAPAVGRGDTGVRGVRGVRAKCLIYGDPGIGKTRMGGITNEQLVDLLETTLKDFPKGMLEYPY